MSRELSGQEWSDLVWLIAVLDDWLLYAEPSTVRELARYLQSVGSKTPPESVLQRLGQLRRQLRRIRVQ
jgi:hypothetical protein